MENVSESQREFFSIKEFALLLRIHANTVRRAIKSGRIGAFKVGSGKKSTYRIPRSEINRIALFDLEDMIKKIIDERVRDK